jgi:hypothetical protein
MSVYVSHAFRTVITCLDDVERLSNEYLKNEVQFGRKTGAVVKVPVRLLLLHLRRDP